MLPKNNLDRSQSVNPGRLVRPGNLGKPGVIPAGLSRATETRKNKASDRVDDARRDLAEQKIAAFVEKTVAAAPALKPELRDRLALLLRVEK